MNTSQSPAPSLEVAEHSYKMVEAEVNALSPTDRSDHSRAVMARHHDAVLTLCKAVKASA